MDISVILCTFNRCQILKQALESVLASEMPDSLSWELLVVDNNSTDQTRQVVEEVGGRNPDRLRYVFESQQGLSRARNAGVREARGDVVVFVDDDVIVDRAWLHALTSFLPDHRWSGAGGRILPRWTSEPPAWLPSQDRYGLAPIAMFDPDLPAGPLAEPPFGANMAFRKEMFEKYGFFRTDLGRCGASMLSNEDTEFGNRLLNGLERIRYEPTAVVYHPVLAARVRKSYFLEWWFNKARSEIRESGVRADVKWSVAGVPLCLFRRLVVSTLRWLGMREPKKRFSAKALVWSRMGEIVEAYRLARSEPVKADPAPVTMNSKRS